MTVESSKTLIFSDDRFLRLPHVLALIPISRSAWYAGVASGRFPASIKLGPKTTVWRASDIYRLIDELSDQEAK